VKPALAQKAEEVARGLEDQDEAEKDGAEDDKTEGDKAEDDKAEGDKAEGNAFHKQHLKIRTAMIISSI
jgi:hypothetical protein